MTYAMYPFQLHTPGSVNEAMELVKQYPEAMFLAGGTDLVVNLRKRLAEPEHVIDVKGMAELRGIEQGESHVTIGAGETLHDIANSPLVNEKYPVLAEAAATVAGPTIRAMGTLGGNLCLDTRCRYYNQSFFWREANDFCLKKDGEVCHVAPGGSFCWAAFSGDTPPALMMLGAEAELIGPQGTRRVPLTEFYGTDGRWSVGDKPGGKQPGELLVRVHIPQPEPGWQGVYEKLRVRESIDYPLVGVAMMVRYEPGGSRVIGELRVGLTAVNPRPELLPELELFRGEEMSVKVVDGLKRLANKTAKPMRTTVVDPKYRRSMVGALIESAAIRLAPELKEDLDAQLRWMAPAS